MNGRFDLPIITQPRSEVYCSLVFDNSLPFSHIPPCFHAKPSDVHVCLAVIYGPYTGEYTPVGGRTRAPLRGRFTRSTTGPLASSLLVKMPCGGRFRGCTTGPRSVKQIVFGFFVCIVQQRRGNLFKISLLY